MPRGFHHRPPRRAALALLAAFAGACAASNEVRCPDPVGVIVRDNCDLHRLHYSAQRTQFNTRVGPVTLTTPAGPRTLQDPSELMLILAQRALALCHEYNACRMTRATYRNRRYELDSTAKKLLMLARQVSQPGLPAKTRRQLKAQLISLVAEPGPAPATGATATRPAGTGGGAATAAAADTPPDGNRAAIEPWFGSKVPPPLPPRPSGSYPRLVTDWGEPLLQNVARPPDAVPGSGRPPPIEVIGYRPRLEAHLYGRAQPGDQVEFRFDDGSRQLCQVPETTREVFTVICDPPPHLVLTAWQSEVEVIYHREGDHLPSRLGSIRYHATRYDAAKAAPGQPTRTYYLDLEHRVTQGWVAFLPEPRGLPPDFERPYLKITFRVRRAPLPKMTARCSVGGRLVAGPIKPGPGSGRRGFIQDQPRQVQILDQPPRDNPDAFLFYWHFEFPLPFVLPRGRSTPPLGLETWPPKVGEWRCEVLADGLPVRILEFMVHEDGVLSHEDGQEGAETSMVYPWWLVRTEVVDSGAEATREGAAR